MSARSLRIAILLLLPLQLHATPGVADFEKACLKAKRKSSVCRCLSANVERKLASQEVEIDFLIQAVSQKPPVVEENQTAFDNAADLIAGFEPNCVKNPKYLGD